MAAQTAALSLVTPLANEAISLTGRAPATDPDLHFRGPVAGGEFSALFRDGNDRLIDGALAIAARLGHPHEPIPEKRLNAHLRSCLAENANLKVDKALPQRPHVLVRLGGETQAARHPGRGRHSRGGAVSLAGTGWRSAGRRLAAILMALRLFPTDREKIAHANANTLLVLAPTAT